MKPSPSTGVLLSACLLLPAALAHAGRLPEKAEAVVDYDIRVRLDPASKQLTGQQRLVWRNPSTDTVPDLWFHLYLNAFKNTESTFVRESGGQLRGDRMAAGKWGFIDITSLKLADGTDLTPGLRFAHPDDDNDKDQTVARLELPQAVPPGGQVTLDIEFTAQLPEVFARTGYKRDFYLVGQWFPKVGVYEPAGTRGRTQGGWNCHQFHAHSEFYADFGHYKVAMTVPRHFVLGATGRRVSRQDNPDGTATYVHEESDIHDFAWTADPTFVEAKRTFSATADVTPAEYEAIARLLDRPLEEVRLSDVEITVLIHRGRLPQLDRHFIAAKNALKYFGLWYGRYPYRTLTIVDPAPGGGGAGGMEYPTFITAGTTFLANRGPLSGVKAVEGVVVHEFGHQFWYGLVASNEFEEAWLDEGFNSYSAGKIMDLAYGPETSVLDIKALGVRLGQLEAARLQNGPERRYDPILRRSWEYSSSGNYAFNSYARPQLTLLTLEGLLGEATMARVMRTYHERWRFRHPSSQDFFAVANEVSGRDLGEFFRQTVVEGQVLDFQVASLSSEAVPPPRGVFEREGKRVTLADKDQPRKKGPPSSYQSRVLVRRRGEVVVPVEIAFQFEGQPLERVSWDGKDRWRRFEFVRPQRLLWARVDPDRKLALDFNRLNDGRRLEGDPRAAAKWTARFLFFVQNFLALLGA